MAGSYSHLSCGALTDVGVRRKNNEDFIKPLPEHGVFCVADGMGGVQGGEVASQAAVTSLEHAFKQLHSPDAVASASGKVQIIDQALNQASKWIKQRADKKGIQGTGTTAVVIAFDGRDPSKAAVVHAGDSRAYRFRRGTLKQITRDHTVANAAGLEDESELPAMFKGVITRAVGVNAVVELEQTPVDVAAGDIYLLCSDGLDKLMTDDDIAGYLKRDGDGDLQVLAQSIVDEVNRRGGVDNISVILIRTSDPDPESLADETDDLDQIGGATSAAADSLDKMIPAGERQADHSVGLQEAWQKAPEVGKLWFSQNRCLLAIIAGCVTLIVLALVVKHNFGTD